MSSSGDSRQGYGLPSIAHDFAGGAAARTIIGLVGLGVKPGRNVSDISWVPGTPNF